MMACGGPKYRYIYDSMGNIATYAAPGKGTVTYYFCWVNTLDPEMEASWQRRSSMQKNQREALSAFLTNSNVPISNNLAENAIRPFAVSRKNWLFCDTVMGAQSSAIVYSLVETAKANGLELFQYLRYILTELPYFGKSPALADLDLLLLWNPYVKQHCTPVTTTND